MEAILRSVLLRQEQMVMQWDAEFEQQKHLFHINTSTLMDMLPIRPRKKRVRAEGRVQGGPIASHDKENLVGFQGFLPSSACAKSSKTEAPQSRGLAKRDLNTRFCDNDVKHAGRMHFSKPAAAEPPVVRSALVEGPNAENVQQSGGIARAVGGSNPASLGVSVKVEVDEGDAPPMRVSPPTDDTPSSPGESRKRARGKEEGASVVRTCDGEDKQVSNDPEGGAMGAERTGAGEKKSKPKKARVVGEAEENAVGVQTCSVAQISPSSEPEIVIKVEAVEAEERSCRDGEAVDATQPEVARRGPARKGRAKGASAASQAAGKAAVADIVSKEPGRRGRAKKAPTASGAAEPEIGQRVTRSRARKLESVVESEADACERMGATQVAGKESGEEKEKVAAEEKEKVAADVSRNVEDPCAGVGNCEAKQGELAADCDGDVEGGSAKQIVAGQMEEICEREVCAAPSGGVPADKVSMKIAAESKERKPVARSRKKHCENNSVAGDMGKAGRIKVTPHAESQEDAACLNAGGEEQSARIASRVAEILASVVNTGASDVKGREHESWPRSCLGRIEENVGHCEAEFEHRVAGMPEGTGVQGGCAPLAPCEAPPAEEETAKNARCFAASVTDTLVGEDSVERTKVARMQVKVTGDGRQAGNTKALRSSAAQHRSPGKAAVALLRGDPVPGSGGTSTKEVSRAMPANTGEAYTALLSQVIEGSTLASAKSDAPVSTPESVVVARPRQSSLRTGVGESVAVALEIAGAGGDASASLVEVLPTEGVTRNSTAADGSVDGRGASGEQAVEDPIALFCEGRAAESENLLEECSMEANIELTERSWQTKEERVQDVVAKSTWEGSRVKEAENARQSMDGASLVDASGGEQVESHAVTPSRFSEARAIQEAMRCSLEQEFHPEVTETLNRWQFRRRLSPRSKARARRWRSDVATNGVDYGRGQSSDAPVASPSRAVSSRDRSLESAAYETFVEAQSPYPEAALAGVEPGFSSDAEKAVDEAHTSWQEHAPQPEGIARRSIASLCNEVLSQALHDGEMGDDSVEYEVMETAEERNGNLSPLLRSIYKLSKACQNDMVGVGGILEEEEQQQVQSLIESAKKIMEQVSSRRGQAAGAPPRTPAFDHPAPDRSTFYDHTNLYPDRFRLFITPGPSSAAPPFQLPCASMFPAAATAPVAAVVPGDAGSTSPPMKHLIQETIEEAVSKAPEHNSALSESSVRADDAVSPARCWTPRSGEVPRMAETGNIHHSGEDVYGSTIVGGTSAIGCASPVRGSQRERALRSCDGSILSIGDRVSVGNAVELVSHDSEVPLSSEAVAAAEKLSGLRSRFYALSKECVAGGSSTAEDVPNLLGALPEASIKHSTNPPPPIPGRRLPQGCASKDGRGWRVSVKTSPQSLGEEDLDAGGNGEPATVMEGETRIPCSPIFVGNQRGHDELDEDLVTDGSSPSHHGAHKAVAIKEETVVLEGTSEACEEAAARTECIATASAASMLRVEPQRAPNLMGGVPGAVSSSSNPPRSNIVASIRSFVPLVQQQQAAAPYPNGKRDVKVKALEAAEAAKRLAEQKELEKQERKRAAEIAKREKQERAALEKLAKREKAAQDKIMKQQEARAEKEKENEEASRRRAAAAGTAKSVLADSSNCQGTSVQNVLLKVKRTYELKQKMDQEKQERLLEEQRRKEEEWKKKETENAARKRKHEADEKREREEKRRRQEEAVKAQREMEERQRLELEKKTQRQKALEDMEKERKAIEEEMKRQKRLDKEREVEQRRKKEQEKEVAWLDQKEVTRKLKEEASKQMKLLEIEGRQQAVKMRRPSEDPAMPSSGPYQSFISSVYVAMGIGEGVGGAHLSGVNNLADPQRVSSQSLVGHPLRVPQRSGEGAGAAFPACRISQAAVRVPRTTPESAPGVPNMVGGSGKPLFRTPPEASGTTAVASVAATSGGASAARALREGADIPHGQSGWKAVVPAVAGGSKPCQPGQVGFAGPPGGVIGQGDKGVQTYEISPFRDSDDEDSEEEGRRSQKPIPQWARKENIWAQLVRQHQQDPDDIFVGASSCSLDEVFEVKGSKKRPDFKRRGSSGDWVQDCLTWQEQIQYKVTMGYLQ